jgi:hypothetical protein
LDWVVGYQRILPCLALGAFLLTISAAGQSVPEATYDPGRGVWFMSNGLLEVQYLLDVEGRFYWWNLQRPGGMTWVTEGAPRSSPIHIQVEDRTLCAETLWTLVNTYLEDAGRGGVRLVILLRAQQERALVRLDSELYPGQPFVRTAVTYRNEDDVERLVSEARYLNLVLPGERRPYRSFHVSQVRQGTPLMFDPIESYLDPETGGVSVWGGAYNDHCTWLALSDGNGQGLVFGWEFDGRGYLNADFDWFTGNLNVYGSPQQLNYMVPAGAEWRAPAAFIGLYEGDWDEAAYRTHRFVEAALALPIPDDNFPYLMFDTWDYGQNIDEFTLRRAAEIAAQVGVELFVVDLGWSQKIGEWVEDPVKFPSGLAAFGDYVRSLGMKFGLHFVPVEAAPDAPVLQLNPEWASSATFGYYGAQSICLAHAPTQSWMRQAAWEVIEKYRPDWFTQDGENLVKPCWNEAHSHRTDNSNWANSVEGLDALVEHLRSVAPQVLWENNGDGGTMSTFDAVKRYVTFSSCDACEHMPRRQAVYGMSYVFPPRYIDRYMQEPPIKFTTRSSMFGGPWILMQRITEWSAAEIALVQQEAAIYKSLRGLIRDGKVFHLTERPTGYQIEAIQSFHEEQDRGVVFVYRPDTSQNETTIHPRGLRPDSMYQVSFQENAQRLVASGRDLMFNGIKVRLPTKNFAEIVYLNRP